MESEMVCAPEVCRSNPGPRGDQVAPGSPGLHRIPRISIVSPGAYGFPTLWCQTRRPTGSDTRVQNPGAGGVLKTIATHAGL